MLDIATRHSLLHRARVAIERAIGAPLSQPSVSDPPPDMVAGAFVTLHTNGMLRGCIGYPEADLPLLEVVERCAVSAATRDPTRPTFRPTSCSSRRR